jgi:hypothetical protein
MATIEVNERTKAGKLILDTAILLSKENKGITVFESEKVLLEKMKKNHKNDFLSETETNDFLNQLKKSANNEIQD